MDDFTKHCISKYPDSYYKIRELMIETYNNPKEWCYRIIKLLISEGIKIRQNDGILYSIEPSLTSDDSAYVIELHYIKKDNSQTVDFFLINKNKGIKYYKNDTDIGSIDKNFIGRHKMQIAMTISKDFIYIHPQNYDDALRDYKKFQNKFGL